MTPVIVRYPLDPTGVNPSNFVQGEVHTLVPRRARAIATTYGGFFSESVVVHDQATNRLLTKDVDYYCAELYEVPTAKYGKEICAVIVIIDETVSDTIVVDYQAIGGNFSGSADVIVQLVNSLELDDRPLAWGSIIQRPSEFPPSHHLHDIGDVYGFEYMVHALERIRSSIQAGDGVAHNAIYKYIDQNVGKLSQPILDRILSEIAVHEAKSDPHPQYMTSAESTSAINSAITTHVNAADPHPVYTTNAEATALATTAANSAVSTHAAASDPHPQYTTNTEASALDTSAIAAHVAAADPHPTYTTNAEASALDTAAIAAHVAAADPHPTYTTNAEATAFANSAVATHAAASDPHPQYTTNAEVSAMITAAGGGGGGDGAAQVAIHEAKPDPHPQYLTQPEGQTLVDTAVPSAVQTGITNHESEADPHPIYMTEAEVDAKIAAAVASGGNVTINGDSSGKTYFLSQN